MIGMQKHICSWAQVSRPKAGGSVGACMVYALSLWSKMNVGTVAQLTTPGRNLHAFFTHQELFTVNLSVMRRKASGSRIATDVEWTGFEVPFFASSYSTRCKGT